MEKEKDRGEVVLYQPNDTIRLEVKLEQETVWLTQQQIADLFCVKQPAISKHLSNIFKEGELEKDSVHSILEYAASDGKIYKTQFYNLDADGNPRKTAVPDRLLRTNLFASGGRLSHL